MVLGSPFNNIYRTSQDRSSLKAGSAPFFLEFPIPSTVLATQNEWSQVCQKDKVEVQGQNVRYKGTELCCWETSD